MPTAAAATADVRVDSSCLPLGEVPLRVFPLPPFVPCFAASVVWDASATGLYAASIATPMATASTGLKALRQAIDQ
jgi:hypothetical protein